MKVHQQFADVRTMNWNGRHKKITGEPEGETAAYYYLNALFLDNIRIKPNMTNCLETISGTPCVGQRKIEAKAKS